ncbi:MAG: translation initiation factor IF-2 [Candidatus Peregrinibacteria bacterium]|nr:translation initiation factor IF-2 [Candidatus Peregrinibacteria bacterium]MDZ4244753.1 translation initiation factor IF-2 [Candidatus Gracilibacteria bacterium]
MFVTLESLAKRIGINAAELKIKLDDLGFEYDEVKGLEEDIADLVEEELKSDGDIVGMYDELTAKEMDKELVKSQRKQMAGKEKKKKERKGEDESVQERPNTIEIGDTISVKEFAEKTGISPAKIIGELMKNGVLANINQQIDFDTLEILADGFGVQLDRKRGEVNIEDVMKGNLEKLLDEPDKSKLSSRPPVVTIMGHVDHGKTKLLDYIRETNVVAGEAGGITQHIGAYQVVKNDRKITFLDTPGHEAFTAMRARGAKVTDIAILVVAGDEGIKPQTVEAINHAKEANVPIIVAITKMDKPNVNLEKVKGGLTENGLQPEDWGGKTITVPVSAMTGDGIDQLLEMILLTADIEDMKANPDRPAVGTVIEAHLDLNLGPVATVLINTGTLKVMDSIIIGSAYGRVKTMKDHRGKKLKMLLPSDTAQISGLSKAPQSGDILQVVQGEREARMKATSIEQIERARIAGSMGISMETLISHIKSGKLKTLKVVLKADTQGSIEAIAESLAKITGKDVGIRIIHSGVGNVTESDVNMCAASHAVILCFHVNTTAQVDRIAEQENVQILKYDIIYNLLDEVKKLLSGLLEPEIIEVALGDLEIRGIFYTKKKDMIIGGKVTSGIMQKRAKVRIERNGEHIGDGIVTSLQKTDKVVDEVTSGHECGIKLESKIKVEMGDILKAYKIETRMRTLEEA